MVGMVMIVFHGEGYPLGYLHPISDLAESDGRDGIYSCRNSCHVEVSTPSTLPTTTHHGDPGNPDPFFWDDLFNTWDTNVELLGPRTNVELEPKTKRRRRCKGPPSGPSAAG